MAFLRVVGLSSGAGIGCVPPSNTTFGNPCSLKPFTMGRNAGAVLVTEIRTEAVVERGYVNRSFWKRIGMPCM